MKFLFFYFFKFRAREANALQVKKPAANDTPATATIAKECQINQISIQITRNYVENSILAGSMNKRLQ